MLPVWHVEVVLILYIQGQGLGSRLLSFAEDLAPVSQVDVVSCRSDLFPMYERRGYVETERCTVEKFIPQNSLTRKGLQFIIMRKNRKSK